jgi:hypothetical protein
MPFYAECTFTALPVLSLRKIDELGVRAPVEFPSSQAELASLIGVSRQTVNQLLQTLVAKGWSKHGSITSACWRRTKCWSVFDRPRRRRRRAPSDLGTNAGNRGPQPRHQASGGLFRRRRPLGDRLDCAFHCCLPGQLLRGTNELL